MHATSPKSIKTDLMVSMSMLLLESQFYTLICHSNDKTYLYLLGALIQVIPSTD